MEQRLHESFPDFQFGSELQESLRSAGRAEEAEKVQAAWLQALPYSEEALTSESTGEVRRGDLDGAVSKMKRIALLFGSQDSRLADLETAAGQLDDAARFANHMIGSQGLDRAEGLLRLGRIDILQGRFSSARNDLERAAAEGKPFGIQGPEVESRDELVGLLQLTGSADDVDAELAQGQQSPAVELERRLLRGGRPGRCPSVQERGQWARDVDHENGRLLLRVAASAHCAPCAAVVSAGRNQGESHQRYLYEFALCAESEGALDLARDTFDITRRAWTSTTNPDARPSMTVAVLSRLQLARVLVRLGEIREARAAYADFLARWGHADRPLREVDAARKEAAALPGD